MERKQATLIAAVVVLLVAVLAGAAFLGQQRAKGGGFTAPAKRFTAKPGTTRENARFLRSKRKPTQEQTTGGGKQGKRPGEWKEQEYSITSITTKSAEEAGAQEVEGKIRSIMAQADVDVSLQDLEQAAAESADPAEKAQLLAAKGKLLGMQTPPRTEEAQAAFDRAAALAPTPSVLAMVQAMAAEQLLDTGDIEGARVRLDLGFAAREANTPASLRLHLLLARCHEAAGETGSAREAYENLVKEGIRMAAAAGAADTDLIRLASMRLARYFHAEGAHDKARALAERVRPYL